MRELLVKVLLGMFPPGTYLVEFQNFVRTIDAQFWQEVPGGANARNVANLAADFSMTQGWVDRLVMAIPRTPSNTSELDALRLQLNAQVKPTVNDPADEVLLEGVRPFVNRKELRGSLRTLCSPAGAPLLLVHGERESGKSFSFYLAQHVGRRTGFITSQFEVNGSRPEELASDILDRVGVNEPLRVQGTESVQRWAERLASQVKVAVEARQQRRLFVFDGFPRVDQPPLPDGTLSFIVRLAKYAEQELLPWLRVLLIEFNGDLPSSLDQVAERDEAVPFGGSEMFSVLAHLRTARSWNVSDEALKAEIAILELKNPSLRDRFQFLRRTIRRLGQ